MLHAPTPAFEDARIADLRSLNLLDTPREKRFDRITDLARDVFDVQYCFLTLVDTDRQWFKSTCGLTGVDQTDRDIGFCAHAVATPEPLVITDATKDSRFADNPFVTGDFHLRFYAGVNVQGPAGQPIGALCLVHTAPRDFPTRDLERLRKFAALVQAEMDRG